MTCLCPLPRFGGLSSEGRATFYPFFLQELIMNIRTSLTLWAAAVVCLAGAAVVIVVHSDAGTPARPTSFQTRFQPALRPDAHIGSFRHLTPVPLDDPAHAEPARTSGPTAEERRHGNAQAHP